MCSGVTCFRLSQSVIALVRSSLEFGAAVWDPYLKQDIEKLEI